MNVMGRSKADELLGTEGRFWNKVKKTDGCWEWMGFCNRYGKFTYEGGQLAHRYSWLLHKGPIPDDLHVLHRCDNTKCVNPEHLFLGTHDDNMKDKAKKGRAPGFKGESHPLSRFTSEDIEYIRSCSKRSVELAAEFNTNYNYINQIRRGDSWKK